MKHLLKQFQQPNGNVYEARLRVSKHIVITLIMPYTRKRLHWSPSDKGTVFTEASVDGFLQEAATYCEEHYPSFDFRPVQIGFDRFNFIGTLKNGYQASQPRASGEVGDSTGNFSHCNDGEIHGDALALRVSESTETAAPGEV
jgi:hypothetical protein